MATKGPVKAPLKLTLLSDVKGLGALGDVVKVKSGFARNYLLPRGLATTQSDDTLRRVQSIRKKAAAEAQKTLEQAKAAAAALLNVSIHIESKAGEGGHLYGSVTTAMIAEALGKQKVAVEPSGVLLDQPIKQLGIYDIKLKLHGDIEASVKLYVVATAPEKAEEPAKPVKSEEAAKPAKPKEATKVVKPSKGK